SVVAILTQSGSKTHGTWQTSRRDTGHSRHGGVRSTGTVSWTMLIGPAGPVSWEAVGKLYISQALLQYAEGLDNTNPVHETFVLSFAELPIQAARKPLHVT